MADMCHLSTVSGRAQVTIVIEALKPGVVSLIRDLNGNHVIQRCLQVLRVSECFVGSMHHTADCLNTMLPLDCTSKNHHSSVRSA